MQNTQLVTSKGIGKVKNYSQQYYLTADSELEKHFNLQKIFRSPCNMLKVYFPFFLSRYVYNRKSNFLISIGQGVDVNLRGSKPYSPWEEEWRIPFPKTCSFFSIILKPKVDYLSDFIILQSRVCSALFNTKLDDHVNIMTSFVQKKAPRGVLQRKCS